MALDYGIIFLIIIVIIIIIAIILIIFANRNNTQNLLLTLPNYRIQDVVSGSYLGLVNLPSVTVATDIPIYTLTTVPFIPFWDAVVTADSSVTDPFGLWKINIIKQIQVNIAEVQIINDVYFTESPDLTLGYLTLSPVNQEFFTPSNNSAAASTFIMTTIAPNTFTLVLKQGNFSVIVNTITHLLSRAFNANVKPATFKLTLV